VQGIADGGEARHNSDIRGGLPDGADLRALGPRLLTGAPDEDPLYPTPAWGWAVPLLVGAAAFQWKDDRPTRVLLALAAGSLLLWLLTYRWERFLVAPTALLVVAGTGALVRWRQLGIVPRVLAALGVAASLAALPLGAASVVRFTGGGSVALGRESPEAFFRRSLPIARLFALADAHLDRARDRILFLGETRHFGLAMRHAAPSVYNRHLLVSLLEQGRAPGQIAAGLREAGYTHLLVDAGWVARSAATFPSLAPLRTLGPELGAFLQFLGPPLAADGQGRGLFVLPVQPMRPSAP
jgi:hypothetical protein